MEESATDHMIGEAIVQYAPKSIGHSGAGWYIGDADYPDEGSMGPFDTAEEAEQYAYRMMDYESVTIVPRKSKKESS